MNANARFTLPKIRVVSQPEPVAKSAPDVQIIYRDLLAIDAAKTRARMHRIAHQAAVAHPSRNIHTNEVLRTKADGLTLRRQARENCDYCFKLVLSGDLISAGGGNRRCSDPACEAKSRKWRAKP